MRNSKLVSLLKELSPVEQNHFLQYLESPFHNKNKTLLTLAKYIIDEINHQNGENLAREIIWKYNFKNIKFDYPKLRSFFNLLIKHLEVYFAIENLKSDESMQINLAIDLSANKRKKLFLNHFANRYYKSFKNNKHYSVKKSIISYLSEITIFQEITENSRRYTDSNLKTIIHFLDAIYYSEYLRQISHIKTRDWEISQIDEESINHILKMIDQNKSWESFPGIDIYKRIYFSILRSDDLENYFKLRGAVKEYSYLFDNKEAKSMYEWLINFGVLRLNKGDIGFLNELFDVYKEFLLTELIYEDGKLHDYNFKNIVTTGLRLKEYDWVEYFIDTYSDRVPEEQMKNTVAYNSAQLNFYRGRFEKVLSLLQEVEYDDLTYNLGAKSMMIATYYELGELDPLYSMLDSFKVYLSRKQNKIPADFRVLYTNLIKFVKQLLQIRQGEVKKIDKLIEDIRKAGSVASMNWLIDKANEMR